MKILAGDMSKKIVYFVFGIFILIGLIFTAVGAWLFVDAVMFRKTAVKADGVVVGMVESSDRDNSYYPVVEFTSPEGIAVRFKYNVSSSPPMFEVGEKVRVIFDPKRPGDVTIDSWLSWLLQGIFLFIGLIFLGIGVGVTILLVRGGNRGARLKMTGRKVQAQVVGVIKGWLRVNNRPSYRIVCKWMDPMIGKERLYKSELLWFDPSNQVGPMVDVFVDMANSKIYYVDISFLKAPQK
jgi:hypothetical protein